MSGETVLSIITGLALSAACGFRVFVPMLVMSVASYNGPPFHFPRSLSETARNSGEVKGVTVGARGGSTLASLGTTNWIVSTAELIGSIVLSMLALLIPALILIVLGAILLFTSRRMRSV